MHSGKQKLNLAGLPKLQSAQATCAAASTIALLRQLVPAVALLHENMPDIAHGAIAPERLVVTANARIIVVEHVLGSALEQLRFSQERYWRELRIAVGVLIGAFVKWLATIVGSEWLSALIVGGVLLVIALGMALWARSVLSLSTLAPKRTTRQVRQDAQALSERVSG